MNAKIVAVPLLAAIWLGSPAKALAQDPDPVLLTPPAISTPNPADPPPRPAPPRFRELISGETTESAVEVANDQRGRNREGSGGGNRGSGAGRSGGGNRGGTAVRGGGNSGGQGGSRGRSSLPRVVVPHRPSPPAWSSSYRRPYYPPAYYDRWAFRTYRWSPLAYVPWSWIYGTAGYANFGYSYGAGYGYGSVYPGYGPGAYGMYPPYGTSTTFETGALRLRIQPRDAQVFVDGFFAGVVDDFDGNFQSLRLEQGGHKIEIRMPGFETLTIDIHIQPNRTLTIREELRPRP